MLNGQRNGRPNHAQSAEHAQPSAGGAPSLSLPKGGGAIRGIGEKFAANPVTGTGAMTVPLATSPGRSGFGPQLALSYDSGAGNGPFGIGWSLSLPAITRKTDKGLPQYRDAEESDVFLLSGSEDLVPLLHLQNGTWVRQTIERSVGSEAYVVQRYRPRIEGLFARIERWTRKRDGDIFWRSISKDNITSFYGKTGESRIADPQDPQRVFSWLICQSYDDNGNAIVYDYVAENAAGIDLTQAHERNRTDISRSAGRYLKRIRYGNTPSRLIQPDLAQLAWLFEVVFDYDEGHYRALPQDAQGREFAQATLMPSQSWSVRKDPFSSYRAGFDVRTYRLCRRVMMFHHFPDELGVPDYLVRATEFRYQETPIASFITSVTQSGYRRRPNGAYLKRSLPSLDFDYSEATVQQEVREVDPESLANLPASVDGGRYQWLDLDGEGLQCVLAEQNDGWYYKRNISPLSLALSGGTAMASARFEPVTEVTSLPSFAQTATPRHQFLDLAGDGQLDCLVLERPLAGFFERTEDQQWKPFRPLPSLPNVEWSDPNLRFTDLDGDGHADILITEHEALTWHPSLAEDGFGPAIRVPKPKNEDDGPTVIFANADQAIFLADMSGDGLTDIVRIRDGEVCYWPNLGYGRFGKKITMDRSPWFDAQDLFDQRRIRLADIDGSGVTDIIYLAHDGVRLYFNQSGNRWSEPQALSVFPRVDDLDQVQALDLLCNGTACLVWTSASSGDARHSMRYIDLMGRQPHWGKPHLLIGSRNNLGAETRVSYAPSTRFYLQDRAAGQPWATRLPFPVHVVERVETYDWVSRNLFVTRYTYHHGFYDGIEREFRGFGRVDQYDTEELGALSDSDAFADATNIDAASYVPTVLTKTWFHTGAYFDEARISRHFEDEYWHEPDPGGGPNGLSDTKLPPEIDNGEMAEAARSLKGAVLRQEVYALDGTDQADRPYTVSEHNYTIKRLQPLGLNGHAVFFIHARETIDFNYERKLYEVGGRQLADPRVKHNVVLAVDDFGNQLQSAAIGYGRRRDDPDPLLTPADRAKQSTSHVVYIETDYTNPILADDDHRAPLLAEARTFDLIKATPNVATAGIINLFGFDELAGKVTLASDGSHDLPYEDIYAQGATEAHPYRRLIEQVRTLYRKNDLSSALPLGTVESLALPLEGYKLAFVPGLLPIYRRGSETLLRDPASVLHGGGYVLGDDKRTAGFFPPTDPDGRWWIPSGNVFYSPGRTDTAAQELAQARRHFFLPRWFRDPFGNDGLVLYDGHDLLLLEVEDALQNKVTVGGRLNENGIAGEPDRATNGSIESGNDYRTLQPALLTDANGNRSAVAFDGLGLVAGTAVMGKTSEKLGDTLDGFQADLTQHEIDQFFANPRGSSAATLTPEELAELHATPNGPLAAALLGNATTRIVYDLCLFARAPSTPAAPRPTCAAIIARETHVSDLASDQASKLQLSFGYSDGFGREIQTKIQAEPGPVVEGGPAVDPRWVSSGWTIFNNKGKPVRQYERFFDDTHEFKFGVQIGVSSTLFYDPVERVVATLHPNNTFEKIVFDPWRQASYDVNDTVTFDPRTDADVKAFVTRLPDADYLPTWYTLRTDPSLATLAAVFWPDPKIRTGETDAAIKTAVHADTPTVTFFDTLGRPFLTIAHNKFVRSGATLEEKYSTRTELDIEGNQLEVIDGNDRIVMRYDYDMLGTRIHQASMEAGERWMLDDVAGKSIYAWDSRGHTFRTDYDQLRRPTGVIFNDASGPPLLMQKTIYGEGQGKAKNHRNRIYKLYDGAGVVTSDEYDFKGNLRQSSRALADDYKKIYDWNNDAVQSSWESFTNSTVFDALNRPISITAPDASVYHPTFNEANLLETVYVTLRGAQTATPYVTNIDYNAKGQRALIEYGNQVKTAYRYDHSTFRLISINTTRSSDHVLLQALSYSYDPTGNITQIRDGAGQTVYFSNQAVTPDNDYTYDAIYRLINAEGREHIGQVSQQQTTWDDSFRVRLPQPGDGQAMRRYREEYHYDPVGNFLQFIHQAPAPQPPLPDGNWTRSYGYNEPSLIEPGKNSNRLSSTTIGRNNPVTETYSYDSHGNMTSMPHLTLMQWDFRDQLSATSRQAANNGTPEMTYYVYDATGQRVRKATERQNGTRKNERIYLGGFEIYREYGSSGTGVALERDTLHVMDDKQRIALVETRTEGREEGVPQQLIRYQFSNHLGSASLELDHAGEIISYEEYYPYGSTSYQAGRGAAEMSLKRYRFTAMERDEESGLSYHTARYYASWLGRWASCDPIGLADIPNLYVYVRDNPVSFNDPAGLSPPGNIPIAGENQFSGVWATLKRLWQKSLKVRALLKIKMQLHDVMPTEKYIPPEPLNKPVKEVRSPPPDPSAPRPDVPGGTSPPPDSPSSEPGHLTETRMGGEGGTAGGGGGTASEAAKGEGAAAKVETGAASVGGDLAKAESGATKLSNLTRVESATLKVGSFIEGFLPGPQDVLLMILAAAADYAAAKKEKEAQAFSMAFAEGLAARLLGKDRAWVISELWEPSCGPGDWGCALTNARNEGTKEGWNFAVHLTRAEATEFLKRGLNAATANRLDVSRSNPTRSDVINLGVALLPTVKELFARAAEEERRKAEAADFERRSKRDWVGNKM
jgi:RHS repeat-associated protein